VMFDGVNYLPDANGVVTIDTPLGLLNLYTQNFNGNIAGDFEYTLQTNAEHPYGMGENDVFEQFTYTLKDNDSPATSSANLTIKIVDDVPVAIPDSVEIPEPEVKNYNIIFALDVSGSMGNQVGNTGKSR